ncbi:MAG: PAS domain S-box protein, partial [Bacteroidetes bacterium]|nr:PAS domain S-box protein [Bacteroidota bacterium]
YLSHLRYIDNAALNFKVDKSKTDAIAIQALNGKEGFVEGLDYRGVDVLCFCAKIKDSDWYLIAKIDRNEAYSELNDITMWFVGITFLIILIFIYVFSYNYKKERAKYFEELYKVESEKKSISDNYKYVVENANDAIIMTNLSGKIVNANERAVSLYLYPKEEILEMNITDLQPDEKKQELREYIDHVTHENGHIFETFGLKKDGTVFPVESSSRSIEINGDKFVQSIIRDITVKKRAHDLLVESEKRFAISFHNNPAWLTIVNLDTHRMIEINEAWTKAFGFSRDEALGKTPYELGIYSEEQFNDIINEIRKYKSVKNREIELKIKAGETRTMLVSRELITIDDVEYLYAMGLDITERKKAEDELRSRELLFRTTLYSIGDGVITTDEKGLVQRMNNVAENLTGWKENEAEGKKLDDVFMIINEDSQGKMESPVNKVLKDGLIVGLANHTILISKDGKRTPIADSGAPIKTAKDEVIGVVLVFRDRTEERIKEEELLSREAKFRSLFENTLEGIALHEMVYDSNGKAVDYRILDVNSNFSAILGIDKSKAVNVLATKLYGTENPPYLEIYSGVAESQKPYSFEVFFEPLNKHFAIS